MENLNPSIYYESLLEPGERLLLSNANLQF